MVNLSLRALDKNNKLMINILHIVSIEEDRENPQQTRVYCLGARGYTIDDPMDVVLLRLAGGKA